MPARPLILFLCGDMMTGRGIAPVLARSCDDAAALTRTSQRGCAALRTDVELRPHGRLGFRIRALIPQALALAGGGSGGAARIDVLEAAEVAAAIRRGEALYEAKRQGRNRVCSA